MNWQELYSFASKQALLGLCFEGIERLGEEYPENLPSIVFTTLSVPLTGDRNPSRKGKDVTALRCSEPLRFMVVGPSKVCAMLCGMGPPGE